MSARLAILFLLFGTEIVQGQKLQFFGLGRAIVSREKLHGRMVDGDTTNPRQGMGGYTLLDMGMKYHPYHHFRTHAILRIKNQFGMFWGEGTSLAVREVKIEGTAARIIQFEIGDLDMKFSPFTLYVPDIYPEILPEIFKTRRRIQEYESFISNHERRLQGLTFFNSLISRDDKHKLKTRILFARSIADEIGGESRMLAGGNVKYSRKESLQFQLNALSNFPLQRLKPEVTHHVVSLDYRFFSPLSKKSTLHWEGEIGTSQQEVISKKNVSSQASGYAFRLNAKWQYHSLLDVSLTHLSVTPSFFSPGAQTPLYNFYQIPSAFPLHGNAYMQRITTLYDHFTQEDILDRSIRNHLYPYFPNYNNIFPYGSASPNRTGYMLDVSIKNHSQSIQGKLEGFMGNELEPELNSQKRQFLQITHSLSLEIHKWLGWSKQFKATYSLRHQNTTRNSGVDSSDIQLSTTLSMGGLEAELAPDFFFLSGIAMNTAYGNEQMPLRSTSNEIYEVKKEAWNEKQWVLSTGLQYKFGTASFVTIHVNSTKLWDDASTDELFLLRQAYLNFTLSF